MLYDGATGLQVGLSLITEMMQKCSSLGDRLEIFYEILSAADSI